MVKLRFGYLHCNYIPIINTKIPHYAYNVLQNNIYVYDANHKFSILNK